MKIINAGGSSRNVRDRTSEDDAEDGTVAWQGRTVEVVEVDEEPVAADVVDVGE